MQPMQGFLRRGHAAGVLLGALALALALGGGAAAETICVPSDHPTIQAAIHAAAVEGDEICVSPGTYHEAINFLGKAVRLYSTDGPEVTIIDATGLGRVSVVTCEFVGAETVLEGFTITGGTGTEFGMYAGGGMFNYWSDPVVRDCVFTANIVEDDGLGAGGAMFNHNSDPTVTDCVFRDNEAPAGGAIYTDFSHMVLNGCDFDGNVSKSYHGPGAGGAIFLGGAGGNPTLTDCTFTENEALNAGAIFNEGSNPTLVRAAFTRNVAEQGGGAISSWWGDLTLTNCTFTENTADWGGAVYDDGESHPTVRDCTFTDNVALHGGGGIYHGDGDWTLVGSTFSGNRGGTHGGAVLSRDGRPRITGCTFTANVADSGGAIYGTKCEATVINSAFIRNQAQRGGGLFIHDRSSQEHPLTVFNTTFVENTAANGRTLALDSDQQQYPTDVRMANCILWNGGEEIWNNDASTIEISFSDVAGGHPGVGNLDADPVCDADGRPGPGSPCIDAGANNAVPADADDLDDDADVGERVPLDLDGRHRFMDDGATPDTGCGAIVVDMGAYEMPGEPMHPVRFGDVDGDGAVGFADLLEVLSAWGPCDPACCPADVDFTRDVGFDDLLIVLGDWS